MEGSMKRLSVIILCLSVILSSNVMAQNVMQLNLPKKYVSFEFYPISDKSFKGAEPMVVKSTDQENGKTYYVGSEKILTTRDVNNADVTYNPADDNMLRLIVRFNPAGKKTLADYTTKHLGEMMGVVIDGELRLVAHIRQPLVNGKVQIYGFKPDEAVDIVRRYYRVKQSIAAGDVQTLK
jgi:preprotein translocase subunit SecD